MLRPVPDQESLQSAHPLVATPALLEGRARPLPGSSGERRCSGELGARTLDTLVAVAEALFSRGGAPPPTARLAYLRRELADYTARGGPLLRLQFGVAAFVVGWVAPLLVSRLASLRRLPLSVRVRALERMERGKVAPLLTAVRAILCLIYYEHPDAAAEAGLEVRSPRERDVR
jgi:hypothetical protein